MKKMFTNSIAKGIRKISLARFWMLTVLVVASVFAGVTKVAAQDASITTPIASFTTSTVNAGLYNEVQFRQTGCSFSSSSYTNCSGFTTGNTLRVDGNTDSFNILTPNSTINQIVVRVQSNNSSAANLIVGFSNDGITFDNFQEFSAPANNANPSCTVYTITAPVNRKYIKMMRNGFGGYTPTGGTGATVRFFVAQVYVNTVCAAPTIGTNPSATPQSVCQNASATALTAAATGSGTISYQWQSSPVSNFSSGIVNVGTNSTSYTPSTTAIGTLYYRAVVTNNCGGGNTNTATSSVSGAVTVQGPLSVNSQSTAAATYPEGASAAPLSVTATGINLSYQWHSSTDAANNTTGDDNTVGTNTDTYTPLTDVQGTLYYYVVVSGDCTPSPVTSAVSGAITVVEACTAPEFFDQPLDFQSGCVGDAIVLGPVSTDIPATYQWYVVGSKTNTGGTAVTSGTGGNTDTYEPPSNTSGTFFYYVVASNGACTTASDAVEVTFDATAITSQSTAAATYSVGAAATALSVTATGQSIGYQWYSNTTASNTGGTLIGGATGNSYTPPTGTLGTTYYYVVVTGTCSPASITSAVSGAIQVVAFATGDYRAIASTNWGVTTTWQRWNGTAWATSPDFPNSATASVYIQGGLIVNNETSGRNIKNLFISGNSTLKSSNIVNTPLYLRINGTTVSVEPGSLIGNLSNGNNADGISLDVYSNNVTVTGGGTINLSRIRTNTAGTIVTIDNDVTINYHGSTNNGNAAGYYTATGSNNILTVNAGKTLTFAPWSCYTPVSGSHTNSTLNQTINVNGTLTFVDGLVPGNAAANGWTGHTNGYFSFGATAGTEFNLNIGSTGTMNVSEFYPNGTQSNNAAGTGTTTFISIAAGGSLNVTKIADFRNAAQTVTGGGTFSIASGGVMRIGSANGLAATGNIQTTTRSFSTGADYAYEGTAAQSAGDGLPSTVNNLTINNTAGVTLSGDVAVTAVLTLTNGKLATGSNKISVATGNSISGNTAARYINGNLERGVASGASTVLFPIGDANNYTPVSLAFGAGNTAGNVTASATAPGVPPAVGNTPSGSGISQTQYINRRWTLTSTISSPDYAATFTYINPADVVGGANTAALLVAKNEGGVWSQPAVASSIAPSVTTVSGITSFGIFSLGEFGACTNNTFTGTGLWSDGARWSCGAAPASGDNVTIASGANATLDVDFTVGGTLALTSTSTLTVNPAITLTISGSANFGGQSVTLLSSGSGTASLGQVTGTLTGATNVTVERYIPNNGFRSWRLLSVPVATTQSIRQAWQEGDANPLPKQNNLPGRGTHITGVFASQALAAAAGFDSVTAQPGMQYWAGTAWGNITSTTQPINNYPAYFLFIRGNRGGNIAGSTSSSAATTLRTTGTVYTGDQLTNIGASAFAVVANVYPSAINFTGLERTGGVSNLFYIWDSKKLNGTSLGMYQTFSSTNSFNALIAGGSYVQGQPNTTIESGQAFFVKSTTAGSITLKETAKVSSSGSLGFRPSPSAISSKLDTRLYNSAEEMLDANTVVFDAVYSKAVAAEDAPKLGNPGWNFAIETAGKLLAVEGTVPVKENEVIQYRMWNMQAGTYRLEVQATNLHVPAGTTAVLEDSYLQTATELNATGSTDVQFTVDQNPASSSANRFRVVFAKGKAAAESKQGYTIAPNPVESGVMNVVFANKAAGRYSVRILGSNGQSAAVRTIVHTGGTANQAISLPATMGSGTYTVEIIAPDKSRTTTIVLVSRK